MFKVKLKVVKRVRPGYNKARGDEGMPKSNVEKIITQFFEEFNLDLMEERIVDYIVRELRLGRRLSAIMQDPYIKNRLTDERLTHLLENTDILDAVENELAKAFETKDFKFSE